MAQCPYYWLEQKGSQGPLPSQSSVVAYCDHPKHSPRPRQTPGTIPTGEPLTCGGDYAEKCPLSEEEFFDVD